LEPLPGASVHHATTWHTGRVLDAESSREGVESEDKFRAAWKSD